MGGDGTINEVAEGIEDSNLPLGVIKIATANVFAIEIGLRGRSDAVADTIAHGKQKPIYPGRTDGRASVMMLEVGFDSRAVAGVDLGIKRR